MAAPRRVLIATCGLAVQQQTASGTKVSRGPLLPPQKDPCMYRLRPTLVVLTICLVPSFATAQAPPLLKSIPGPHAVDLGWGVKIPLRDGVRLNATVYKPKANKATVPAIVSITPYISDNYHDRAVYFASHGYAFAIVDSRGRGNSEGAFEPFVNEGRDGYDVVEWLARQSWSNGKVGMWGGSYGGFNQWATLKELPPHLATIVPTASAHPGVDFPAPGGILRSYLIQWLTLTSGNTLNRKLFLDDAFWLGKFRELYRTHTPYRDLDVLVGNPSAHFRKWLLHRTPDAFWEATVPTPEQYARFDIPILTITGHYDDDQPGAMEFYLRHARHAKDKAFSKHFLILGPWDHDGTRTTLPKVGGLTFGPLSMVDMNLLHKHWYDWTLRDGPKPPVLKSQILYYVAGLERWKNASSPDGIKGRPKKLYLSTPSGRADDAFHSGLLATMPPEKQPPDRYAYDPLDTRPGELEKEKIHDYLIDQRFALNLHGAGLVYHSEPLAEATEITGQMKLTIWVEMDVQDTDFQAAVYEIKKDGGSVLLGLDQLRARFRESPTQEKLSKPGEINRYTFKGFNYISRQLAAGSRLRLVVGAANSIFLEKNYNSGLPLGTETKKDAQTAHVRLHHDPSHPSCLELPEALPGPEMLPATTKKTK
jgi:putative CocE/NonD family hydrolase